MSRLATRADFEGLRHGRPARSMAPLTGELVERPTWLYDDYRRYPFFSERAVWIKKYYPKARTVLVAGCAFGFLVDELGQRGIDAWGFDASQYAHDQARAHLPDPVNARVLRADAGDADGLTRLLALTGVHRFDLVVTEDLLPCADDDAEARVWLDNLRPLGKTVLHVCTPRSDASHGDLLWKTHAEWAAFCAPDPVLCTECWGVRTSEEDRP